MAVTTINQGWLLLLFFLPSQHAHARVQAWRRLQRLGAVLLKNSGWALPESPESREDFEWIRGEIVAAGGQAIVLAAQAPNRATADDIVGAFRDARTRDFEALAAGAARLVDAAGRKRTHGGRRRLTQGVRRLRERFEEVVRRDFYGAPAQAKVAALLRELDQRMKGTRAMKSDVTARADTADYRRRRWLTRPRPGVDRMSSAWLIRRFIDPDARFVFTDPAKTPNAIPFDTFDAEFGHHGTHCTFETLCDRFGIADPAVQHIGRIVHDLDLKEGTHAEPEAPTIGRLVEGLRRAQREDDALLQSGMEMFEALYQSLATAGPSAASTKKRQRRRRTR